MSKEKRETIKPQSNIKLKTSLTILLVYLKFCKEKFVRPASRRKFSSRSQPPAAHNGSFAAGFASDFERSRNIYLENFVSRCDVLVCTSAWTICGCR